MAQALIKVVISALLIVAAAEIGKRSALLGAILISIPLSSAIALSFLYFDTRDPVKVVALAKGIFLMIVPSLAFFALLIGLLKLKQPYWLALTGSAIGMAAVFALYAKVLELIGVKL